MTEPPLTDRSAAGVDSDATGSVARTTANVIGALRTS